MNIRRYKDCEYKEVTKVHIDTWRTAYKDILSQEYLNNKTYESRYDSNREFLGLEDVSAFVALEDDEIIAFASCGSAREIADEKCGELYAIYMIEKHHGRGYGSRLFNRVKEELKDRGFDRMILWALKENKTCRFYENMGGKKSEESKWLEYGDRKVEAVSYEWKLK